MVNRAIAQAHQENRHELIPYQRALGIAGSVLAVINWIPEQAREEIIRDVAHYIASTGGNSIRELTRYVGNQLSGFDGATLQIAQDQIISVSRQLAAQAQQAGVRARERLGEMVNEEFNTDERRISRHIRYDLPPDGTDDATMLDAQISDHNRNVNTELNIRDQRTQQGRSFYNLPWKAQLKNRKQIQLPKMYQWKDNAWLLLVEE